VIKQIKGTVKDALKYVGKTDHIRSILVHKEVYEYALERYPDTPMLQILYLEPENMIHHLLKEMEEDPLPYELGKCILLACSMSLRHQGSFNEIDPNDLIPYFEPGVKPKFKLTTNRIQTKASIVEEAGQKTRLITTTWAAKAQLETCLNHVLRQWLSRDPFLRIGLAEPHKLYELLKKYKKFKEDEQLRD